MAIRSNTFAILKTLIPYYHLLFSYYGNISLPWKELYQELCTCTQIIAYNTGEEIKKFITSELQQDLYNLLKDAINIPILEQKPSTNCLQYSYKYLIYDKYQLSHAVIFAIADLYKKGVENIEIIVDNDLLAVELFHSIKAKLSLVNTQLDNLPTDDKYQLLPPTGIASCAQKELTMFIIDITTLLFAETPEVQLLFYILRSERNKFSSWEKSFKACKLHGMPLSLSLSYDEALKEHLDLENDPTLKIINDAFLQAKSLSSKEKVHLWFKVLHQLIVFYNEEEKEDIASLYAAILDIIADYNIEYNFLQWFVLNIVELEKELYLDYFSKAKKTIQFVKSASLTAKGALIVADIALYSDYNCESEDLSFLNTALSQASYCYFINTYNDDNINNITDIVLSALKIKAEIVELKDLLYRQNIPSVSRPIELKITKDLLPERLFATSIGLLMKNPREFFIQHILHLKPIDEFARVSLRKMIGISMHKAIEQASIHKTNDIWITKLFETFLSLTENAMEEWDYRYYHHIILPAVANDILSRLNLEVEGYNEHYISCDLTLSSDYKISIAMIIDRLEITNEMAKVIDYKTGIVPSNGAVLTGIEPQLLLAKFILQDKQYGFSNCGMSYIKVLPKVSDKNIDYSYMCYDIEEQLQTLLNHYFIEENPFV